MNRTSKSQWNFGELFTPSEGRKIYSVTELTLSIRRALEKQLGQVWVTGEVTNFRLQSSGHIYFTLKDATAQLSCVLFRGEPISNRQVLQDGQKVVLSGPLTVYEPRGQYQLRVTSVELQGVGALQQEFERLKQKLKEEGLFAPERKRPIPRYPQRIGLVTSGSGAALRDVLHVVQRRQPGLQMILASCRVQGQGSGQEIACAIQLLNQFHQSNPAQALDLILVTRGGGSLEDLWAFNEEVVARAIFESKLPVISAVGHEIDYTISDFVADLRAATPSAAAEIITEGVFSSCQFVGEVRQILAGLARRRLTGHQEDLQVLKQRLARAHPRQGIQEKIQYLDDLQSTLLRCLRFHLRDKLKTFGSFQQRFLRIQPMAILLERRLQAGELQRRFQEQIRKRFLELKVRHDRCSQRLQLLSPQSILDRGYSITTEEKSGRVIRSAGKVKAGQVILTRLAEGEIRSKVEGG